MRMAEKFNKPVITLIDTPGAYPGIGAEERGQAEAIARNLFVMASLKVPIISVVIGEGGSGGGRANGRGGGGAGEGGVPGGLENAHPPLSWFLPRKGARGRVLFATAAAGRPRRLP